MRKRKRIEDFAYFLVILILVLVILYSGLRLWESTVFHKDPTDGDANVSKDIIRGDTVYWPRQDITVVLVMGIDQNGPVKDSGSYTNPGMADMVVLLIFDEINEYCNILCLNRDTMLKMPVLGIGGKPVGEQFGQLALSHTFGNGLEESCLNTRKAVSDFLYGINIDHYISMNMDAISILNDAVGGVTVNVKDDFSSVDSTITMGEVKLNGEQALHFVRTRKGVGDQLNLSRIERHREYMRGFSKALKESLDNSARVIVDAYEQASPYIVTDCSTNVVNMMIERYENYKINEIVVPEGENVMGGEYVEFHVDEAKLDELILRLFYAPKNHTQAEG